MPRRLLIGLTLVAVFAAPACASDEESRATTSPEATSTSTTSPDASTTARTPQERSCGEGVDSSPATFDPSGGLYVAFLTDLDVGERTITFDVVQWLTGERARESYLRDHPEQTDGPPDDFYVDNASPQVRTAEIAPDAAVWLVRLQEDSDADVDAGTLNELPSYLAANRPQPADGRLSSSPFWLTVEDGSVTAICEQYTP